MCCYIVLRVSTSVNQPSAVFFSRQTVTASCRVIRGGNSWYISFITAGTKYMYRLFLLKQALHFGMRYSYVFSYGSKN